MSACCIASVLVPPSLLPEAFSASIATRDLGLPLDGYTAKLPHSGRVCKLSNVGT